MPPPAHIDPATVDLARVVADREAIRKVNRHRFAMEIHYDNQLRCRNTLCL